MKIVDIADDIFREVNKKMLHKLLSLIYFCKLLQSTNASLCGNWCEKSNTSICMIILK